MEMKRQEGLKQLSAILPSMNSTPTPVPMPHGKAGKKDIYCKKMAEYPNGRDAENKKSAA